MPAFGLARFGDEPLARLVPAGDERAFAALYERYHQPLYRYCRSIVRDEADAQDALQSTFARALVALRRGQRNAPVRPWLFRIAHNEAISVLRRRDGSGELSEAAIQSVPSAADQAGERERFALLVADLHELPERLRGALLMRELSGLSHEEIAIALETSPGAAKQAIFDARRELLAFAEGRAMACDEILRNLSDGDRRVLRGRRVRAHLRDCQTCAAFAAAIPARRSELQAFVPALPPVASAAMLARLVGSGSGHGAGGGAAAAAAGAAGKAVGASVAAKVLVGAAVVAVVGATGATVVLTHTHHGTSRPPAALHAAPAAGGVAQRSTRTAAGVRASEAGGRGAKALRLGATGGSVAGAPGIARARAAGGAAKALGLAQSSAGAAGRSHGQGSPVQGGAAPGRSGAAPGRSGSTPATVRHAGGPSSSSLAASHRGGNGGTHASGANGSSHRAAGGGASSVASSTPAGTAPSSSQASRSGQTPAASRRSSHAVRLAATSGAG